VTTVACGKSVEHLLQEPRHLLPPGFPSASLSTENLSCLAALVEGVCGCGKLVSSSAGVLSCHLRLCKPEGQEMTGLSLFSSEILILGRWYRMSGCLRGTLCWRKCEEGRARGALLLIFSNVIRLHFLGSSTLFLCAIRI